MAGATRTPEKARDFAQQHGMRMLPGFEVVNWFGLWMPASAPPELVRRVHAAVAAAVAKPDVRQQFETLGLEGVAMPPERFAVFVADQARIAQEIGRRVNR